MIELRAGHGHLVTTNVYDEVNDLNLVASMTMASPGWQLNGHRADCRCRTCRPDLVPSGISVEETDRP